MIWGCIIDSSLYILIDIENSNKLYQFSVEIIFWGDIKMNDKVSIEEIKWDEGTKTNLASIICSSFNQDRVKPLISYIFLQSWLAVGTNQGYRIYDTETLRLEDSCERENFPPRVAEHYFFII
jgi:hypothetical protein